MRSANFNPQGLVGILCSRAEVHIMMGHGSEALSDLDRAWDTAGGIKPLTLRRQLQLECLRTKWGVHSLRGNNPELRETAEQALEISRELQDRKGEGVSLQTLGNVHYNLGEYDQALNYYHRSLAIKQEIEDRQGEASSLNNIAMVHYNLGGHEQALDHHRRSLAIRQKIGDRQGESRSLNNIGVVHDNLGEYEQALVYYYNSLKIEREIGDLRGEANCLNNIGLVEVNLGTYEQALDHHRRSLAVRQEIGDRHGEAASLDNIGNVLLELGDYPEAEKAYQKGEALTQEIGAREIGAYILTGLASLYLDQGNLLLAGEKIGQLRDLAGALNSKNHQGMVHCLLGRLNVVRGEGGPARAAFREAIDLFKRHRNELELGKVCYYYARGLKELGDEGESEWYRVQAKGIFQHLGARGWLAKIEGGKEQPGGKA